MLVWPDLVADSQGRYRRYRDDSGRIDPFIEEEDDESEWPDVDLGGFPRGFSLVKICLRIVWKDKEILVYQIISATLCLALLVVFLSLLFPVHDLELIDQELDSPVFILKLFPYYVLAFFIGTFFRAATIAVATIRMEGGNPVFADGLEAASRRIHVLFGWAVVSAIVGVVLAMLQRKGRGGRLAANIANLAWGIATYFAVPVMLFEDEGPLSAIGRSTSIVRRTWRESLAGNFGMGLVFLGLALLGFLAFPFAYVLGGLVGAVLFIMAYITVLSIFSSAASGVLVASLYRLARTGKAPAEVERYEPLSRTLTKYTPTLSTDYSHSRDSSYGIRLLRRV